MNFDFADRVRKVLAQAREESVRLGHEYTGTEHQLLGVLGDAETAALLAGLGARPAALRERVEGLVWRGGGRRVPGAVAGAGGGRRRAGDLPYTSRAKKVLEFAIAEAKLSGDASVGVGHMLLGLIREEKGIGAQVLGEFGITLERVRAALGSGPAGGGGSPAEGEENARFRIRIDDDSSASIYEQIVAQVQEAVATGELKAGDRLATVRRLADQLDIAPGTVARAYGELERLGVVVTDGARGTRIAEPSGGNAPTTERRDALAALLRPVAVAAYHMGASAAELRAALDASMEGILREEEAA
ncbi:MAG TPA: Clp protease N-terminal domain-containing protein [Gemmatimonadota bacterium]|nr:Clp protease N-terminal domain-containing protein [Gemmatimonadota bacterium]